MIEGSSPRVRGKRIFDYGKNAPLGLIPACAGKTLSISLVRTGSSGSSPRVRGKLPHRTPGPRRIGLIPACAGKTMVSATWFTVRPAHPRVCGENLHRRTRSRRGSGSSPRVRGKRCLDLVCRVENGLIPACAGKTLNDLEF